MTNLAPYTSNLISVENLTEYGLIFGCGFILSCTLFYLIKTRTNNLAIPSNNVEAFTYEEIEAIVNENAVTVANHDEIDIDSIIDSDSDTYITSDMYESSSDDDSESEIDIADLDLFYMPNVDFDVCSLQDLKFFEISSIFHKEIPEKEVTDEELMSLICYLTEKELLTNSVND